jgi:hypothetical protein
LKNSEATSFFTTLRRQKGFLASSPVLLKLANISQLFLIIINSIFYAGGPASLS